MTVAGHWRPETAGAAVGRAEHAAEECTAELVVSGGSRGAELPEAGRRISGVLVDCLRRARRSVSARGHMRVQVGTKASWRPEELLGRRLARNATTWAALQRLGIQEGSELRLDFFFETGGREADRELAGFLRAELDHQVVVEADGISGRTRPMVVSASALDEWARVMLYAGFEHGGCRFAGWTATVSR